MATPITTVSGIGSHTAEILAENGFENAEALAAAQKEDLMKISGFGLSRAEKVIASARAVVAAAEINEELDVTPTFLAEVEEELDTEEKPKAVKKKAKKKKKEKKKLSKPGASDSILIKKSKSCKKAEKKDKEAEVKKKKKKKKKKNKDSDKKKSN